MVDGKVESVRKVEEGEAEGEEEVHTETRTASCLWTKVAKATTNADSPVVASTAMSISLAKTTNALNGCTVGGPRTGLALGS